MAEPQPVIKPTQDFKFGIICEILDMRDATDLLGKELADLITRSVAKTQSFILAPLPNWLILSHKQFDSLLDYTQPMEEGNADGRIFITPYNVMEVDVDLDLDPVGETLDVADPNDPGFDYYGTPQGGRFSQT